MGNPRLARERRTRSICTYGSRMFVLFSASGGSTENYCLGLLSLKNGAENPMDASRWSKTDHPVFAEYTSAPGRRSLRSRALRGVHPLPIRHEKLAALSRSRCRGDIMDGTLGAGAVIHVFTRGYSHLRAPASDNGASRTARRRSGRQSCCGADENRTAICRAPVSSPFPQFLYS